MKKNKLKEINISLFEFILEFAEIFNFIDGEIHGHSYDVAYIVMRIVEKMDFNNNEKLEIVLAALLHDIGVLKENEMKDLMNFEVANTQRHEKIGFFLLNNYRPFKTVAYIVRHHHIKWNEKILDEDIHIGSYIISLADRFAILINGDKNYYKKKTEILDIINKEKGKMFSPELVDILNELVTKEEFWLNIVYGDKKNIIYENYKDKVTKTGLKDILSLGKIISFFTDSRDRFTAIHSTGVAYVAGKLAKILNYSERDQEYFLLAGFLHDIGKVAIPIEIIDKKSALTNCEFETIKSHTYHTYRILDRIKGFDEIAKIAAYHHEKLNGKGYPFGLKGEEITKEARIMAVADVFTALSEKRPYRDRMGKEKIIEILESMGKDNHLDKEIVNKVKENYENLEKINIEVQKEVLEELKIIDEFIY
ncbi:HD domain-containing phosphohydrolase [Haliovirga abyssi]|uniref:Hydrolase n=1 Tax=Haliovirga abyssi TaxID=2996794 RepID=A0AAU9D173_9FUSO|nr:HD domain-containing phosphohydrolase [Haliovirga abyssi]BDU49721.1 hydrolase [Haliovirga abyssi]